MERTDIVALVVVLLVMGVWGWVAVVMDHPAERPDLPPPEGRRDSKPPS